jgi:hypothetical protein
MYIFAGKNQIMNRISLFTTLFIALMITASTFAKSPGPTKYVPKLDLGIKFGANYDHIKGTGWASTYQTGYHGGMFVGFREQVFGVQGEALISSGQYAATNGTNVKNLYLNIPGLFEIRLVPRMWLQLGPQYTFLLSSKYSSSNQPDNLFKPGGFSGVAGLQFLLPLHLTLGGRYIFGITDWNSTGGSSWRQSTLQLFVGFKFL